MLSAAAQLRSVMPCVSLFVCLPSVFFPAPVQVGYKRLPYMCLHAESVLDLIEKPQRWAGD